jgi:hypothetical protein
VTTPILGRQRLAGWTRLSRGLYVPTATRTTSGDLAAWSLLLPPGSAFSHLTAARQYGWWLPEKVPQPVFVAALEGATIPIRPNLLISRHQRPLPSRMVAGIRLTSPSETLLAAARDLGILDLVIMGDSALRMGHCTVEDLWETTWQRRRGVRMLRTVIPLLDQRSESPWESVLRVLHQAADIDVEPQHDIYDDWGHFVGRGDLWIKGTRRVHEYDGAGHREEEVHASDLDRDRRFVEADWERCGFTARTVLRYGGSIIASADRLLQRPWDPRRLQRWNALVADSLFGPVGRARVRRKWQRALTDE